MDWAVLTRSVFIGAMALLLVGSLLGILISGPIVVRAPRMDAEFDISPERMRGVVETLCTELAPRSYRYPGNLDRGAEWIAERFREAGLDVEFQEYELDEGRFRNVIARKAGTEPAAGSIVIGAHYDAVEGSPGADDNASGVAVLLELAATLPDLRPAHSWIFAAFSTEEPPFFGTRAMGSHRFAERLWSEGTRIDLMISLDLIGYFSSAPDSQGFPFPALRWIYPNEGNFVAVVGDLDSGKWIRRVKTGMISSGALPVHSFRASPRWAPVHESDHWAFRQFGLPGVLVTDTAYMRYPHYHTPEDTPERLDYEMMGRVVRALHGVLWEGNRP